MTPPHSPKLSPRKNFGNEEDNDDDDGASDNSFYIEPPRKQIANKRSRRLRASIRVCGRHVMSSIGSEMRAQAVLVSIEGMIRKI